MDYTTQRLGFKIRKAVRYVRLYGVRRTLVKIKGQYHMKKRYGSLPALPSTPRPGGHIGIIGCGNHAFSNIAVHLHKRHAGAMRGAMDIDVHKAASFYENYGLRYYTDDAQAIVADPAIDLVFIASNHASHAEYAIRCIEAGKRVHIEKPHVVSEDQLGRLASAMRSHPDSKVFLGFNRPHSVLFRKLQTLLSEQRGPLMVNWFVAGHEIPDDHWYFDEREGGRVLGNLCHWTDLSLHMVGMKNAFPCTIVPATPPGSKSDYVVSMMFADRSCASITFSAKGHTFEGVREVLNVHKGDLLANLTDFESLTAEIVARKYRKRLFHRDHGQGLNVLNSVSSTTGEDPAYVVATAKLFLAVRQAIDGGRPVTLTPEQALTP
ncbi:MAG: Gfo/Idh/MocA family oxidoreductase [Rubrivivax sp.]|nr:Gfo/Idh/MocA family oxidoreductase [Rubrivivax sp.]